MLRGGGLALLELLLPSLQRLQELGEDLSRETEAELHCPSLSLALPPCPSFAYNVMGWEPVGTPPCASLLPGPSANMPPGHRLMSCCPHNGLRGQASQTGRGMSCADWTGKSLGTLWLRMVVVG